MNEIKGIIEDVEKSNLVSNKVIKKVIEIIGQEEWNDLYDAEDDICTTTGELIITLKGILDLEKENTELKDKLNNLSSVAEQKEKQIQKLKRDKQNLRAELRIARNNLQVKDTAYQLAMEEISCIQTDFNTFKSEAKDIIRNLLRVTYGEGWNYSLDVKVKAEKFLEENE